MILVRLTREDLKVILRDMGSILLVIGYILLLPLAVAYIYGETELYFAFLYPSVASIWLGFILKKAFRNADETKLRHAMISAGLSWVIISLIGAFPYMHYGISFVDSYFESMSGFTTSGLTIIKDIEAVPMSILFWRGLTQWIGGVGVIMLFLVVLVQAGTVATRFYAAQYGADRISPSISKTVKQIWKVYIFYTIVGVILYFMAGMGWFDAVVHTFAALSTGGFSTKTANIGAYGSVPIEAVSILLMVLGGISFFALYKLLIGEIREFWKNPEIRAYLGFIPVATLFVFLNLFFNGFGMFGALRHSIFQVVSAVTTTGFSTVNISMWPEFSKAILMFLMVAGGSMGSTAGGLKILRTLILLKLSYYEIVKALIPEKAVISFKIREKVLENEDLLKVANFFFLYIAILFASSMYLTATGYGFFEAVLTVASAEGTVGLTPVSSATWFATATSAKVILILNMWIGRLEIFPALVLLGSIIESMRRTRSST